LKRRRASPPRDSASGPLRTCVQCGSVREKGRLLRIAGNRGWVGRPIPEERCRAGGSTSALSGSASIGSRRGFERRRAVLAEDGCRRQGTGGPSRRIAARRAGKVEGEWMDKVRVRDLAKELGMGTSKEFLAFLERIGVKGKSASSNLEGETIDRVRAHFRKPAPPPPPPPHHHDDPRRRGAGAPFAEGGPAPRDPDPAPHPRAAPRGAARAPGDRRGGDPAGRRGRPRR